MLRRNRPSGGVSVFRLQGKTCILWIFSVVYTDCNVIYLACGFCFVFVFCFFPEKEHRLATIPSLFSMYFRGNSLCAQIMMPVWHAESSSVMSGSFRVRDRDWGTLETQGSCSGVRQLVDSGLLEIRP